jgi:hypothetical protein
MLSKKFTAQNIVSIKIDPLQFCMSPPSIQDSNTETTRLLPNQRVPMIQSTEITWSLFNQRGPIIQRRDRVAPLFSRPLF